MVEQDRGVVIVDIWVVVGPISLGHKKGKIGLFRRYGHFLFSGTGGTFIEVMVECLSKRREKG